MELYLLFFITVFAGSVIQGAVSFGYAMFLMALLPYLMPVKTAVVLSAISSFFISGTVCWRFRKRIDFRAILIPLLTALAFIPPGVYLLSVANDRIFRKILGIIIATLSILFMSAARRKIRIQPTLINKLICGAASGILAGMFGVGGPPLVFYLLAAIEDNIAYKASLEVAFVTLGVGMVFSHGLLGNFAPHLAVYIGLSGLATIGGTLLGLKLFQRLDRERLQRFVYFMMLILGALLILK
ncbi:MAG: sulfite exporter TauE/SafE family protein [Bacillota bacterium]|jgi:uncharacterized membrane protein YfcA